ncbi:hypothetical protein ACFY19_00550 [Streptosporangium saharense]|uniref:hypothetical protein n=1 Tax=Streptosporangium saharense TaxID=1706840 RepID=UPI0036CAE42A
MLWKATMSAFPNRADVLSIADYSGCDSANSGAWLDFEIKPEATREEIEGALERTGWSKNVKRFMPYGSSLVLDMARRWEGRTIGLTLSKEPENASRTPWVLEVRAVDHCWTDEQYTCPGLERPTDMPTVVTAWGGGRQSVRRAARAARALSGSVGLRP